ncbi:MAG TPA: hypothetical protein VHH11_11830 [Gammaproteobacteria bacterium]|jgi:hypothetical protein|nr:hypothetical protein [Gammaproteobacteria bacterium]
MEVRVLNILPIPVCPEPDYLRVHTEPEPYDDTVVLATIERVTDRARPGEAVTKRIRTLVARRPMPVDAVLTFAMSYAARKHIPVVYADGDPGSAA